MLNDTYRADKIWKYYIWGTIDFIANIDYICCLKLFANKGNKMRTGLFKNKNIYIALTYKCNAKCQKCLTRYHINRGSEMSPKMIDVIYTRLCESNYQGMVSVGSGEPILYPYLEYFIEKILSLNDNVHLRLLTNGQAFTTDLPVVCYNRRCKWGVTMDGFVQTDLIGLQEHVSIETVKKNIISVVETYGSDCLYLNFTLNNRNYRSLIDYCKFALSLNIPEIYVTELKIYEGYNSTLNKYRLCRNNEVYETLRYAKQLLSDNGISSPSFNIDSLPWKNQCYFANRANPVIDVDGTVTFCGGHEDLYVGNIQDPDIEKKWIMFAEQLISDNVLWCEHCHDRILPNGLYSLPKTIKQPSLHDIYEYCD